jgi:hypothetical protein
MFHVRCLTFDLAASRQLRGKPQPVSRSLREGGFTLAELLVSMSVLVLLVFLATQLLNSAATVTILGYKKMDADSEARQIFDRMDFDFQQMVKRTDVDYYLKAPNNASDCGACGNRDWTGNDQAAFYSTVPGYYPTPTAIPTGTPIGASPVSLVSYRVNSDSTSSSYHKLERMGKGLAWNGVSPDSTPPNSSLTPVVYLPQTIGGPQPPGPPPGNWPSAVSTSAFDSNYEVIGPQVFRFEYYYLLKNEQLSSTPWYGVSSVRGLQDVSAIIVNIAVIDPKSKVSLSDAQIATLAGTLIDYGASAVAGCPSPDWQSPGELQRQWQCALDSTNGLPRAAISGIRVYEHYFYLTHDLSH